MTEEERILAEVERRRERAKELGLLDLLTLFRDHLEFLKQGQNPDRLPKSVTGVEVADIRLGRDSVKVREVFLGEKTYLFVFKQRTGTDPSGEPDITGHLLLIRDGQTLFDLHCLGGTVWQPFEVDVFIEGTWVQEIMAFSQEVFELADQRDARLHAEHKKKKLEDLKKKFGLS